MKQSIQWALVGWLVVTGTLWLWFAGVQPSPIYTPSLKDTAVFCTGAYALWLLCLHRKNVPALLRGLMRSNRGGLVVSLMTTTLLCSGVELSARWLGVMSDSYAPSGMMWTWYSAYWLPVNSLSFRDVEPYPAELTNVLVVGDSYVAGYGIENHSDMMNRIVQEQLGAGYGVNIAADPGLQTVDEFSLLQDYPITPEIVVWSHHPNDILWQDTRARNSIATDPRGMFEWLMGRLYTTDYIFIHRLNVLQPAYEFELLAGDAAWARHTALLGEVVEWCRARSIRLVFVSWELWGMHYSPQFVSWAVGSGQQVIDTADLYENAEFMDIAASPLDAHPNERVIAEVAGRIIDWIRTQNLDALSR